MRISGGNLRGRTIRVPKDDKALRPTSDRVREAIFSMLASYGSLDGALMLDLFAGSGVLGMEALSRGARHAVFVERAPKTVAAMRKNLAELELEDSASIFPGEVFKAAARLREILGQFGKDAAFDFIFADPPYKDRVAEEVIEFLSSNQLVHGNSIFVFEHDGRWDFEGIDSKFNAKVVKEKRYGDTFVSIFSFGE